MNVPTIREKARGCGFRKPGGLYMVSGGDGVSCSQLPIELSVCPTCSGGIKPTRGWTWIQPNALSEPESHDGEAHSLACPLSTGEWGPSNPDRAGLLWIGGQFYTPGSFIQEAQKMGISRRLAAIPRGFEIGDWVMLAHREALQRDGVPVAAVFYVFRPERMEYVVREKDTEADLEKWVRHGVQPVRVEPVE
jgi:hypothetical protein